MPVVFCTVDVTLKCQFKQGLLHSTCTRRPIECHQTLPPPVHDTESNSHWDWLGLACEATLFYRYTTKHAGFLKIVSVVSPSWIAVIRQEEQGHSHAVLVGIGGQACTHGRNHMAAATLQKTQ